MFLIPEGLIQGSSVGVGRYIYNAMIPAFLGNIVGAALLALPLLYLHGGNEFDPRAEKETVAAGQDSQTTSHSGHTLPTTMNAKEVESGRSMA